MASQIRIRMYRTGFGDCFLLSFGPLRRSRHVLIDFGTHMRGDIGAMELIVDSIESTTGRRLELIIATHAHRDHISGFGKFSRRFAEFEIGEIWMPWTENKHDREAATLARKHIALYDFLDNHIRIGLAASNDPKYAAALEVLSNLRGNEVATSELARGFGSGAQIRYMEAGTLVDKVGEVTGLSAEILAPSKDQQFLSRMDPPASQRFLTSPTAGTNVVRPFPQFEVSPIEAQTNYNVTDGGQPLVPPSDLDALHTSAEVQADRLALALDNVRNNTSLVVLFRFRDKSLLFPGDAQWGNWQSWVGNDKAHQVLGELNFLKVAHHGSANATPVEVVEALDPTRAAAMVSTQVTPFPTIPRLPLMDELRKHCEGNVVVRSDWIHFKEASVDSNASVLPNRFKAGQLWIDYTL